MPKFFDRCCNPLNFDKHLKKSSLRHLPGYLAIHFRLSTSDLVCSACHKKLLRQYAEALSNETDNDSNESIESEENSNDELVHLDQSPDTVPSEPSSSGQELLVHQSSSSMSELSLSITLPTINKALALLNQSPVSAQRRASDTYLNEKVTRVARNLRKALGGKSQQNDEFSSADSTEIINSLREKFNDDNSSRSTRVQILTLLPSSWSVSKVMEVMGASEHMVRKAKNLVAADGILSVPEKKTGRELSDELVTLVTNFYNDDEMSSMMPGKKDFISVRNDDGIKVQSQKRLVLCNLKELHKIFISRYPDVKIGFSSFASLRPKHCILAGGSGTHTVCVCSIHQNIKLMILGANFSRLTEGTDLLLKTYNDCLDAVVCQAPSPECFFNNCSYCPGVENLKKHLLTQIENNEIDQIQYKQWVSTPRVTLETTIKNTNDFVDDFGEKLKALLPHNFIAKEQAAYLRQVKETLKENEFIVIVDFAENYSFVVQDAAPGFHWNNDQATIYTVVIYYKKDNELKHQSMAIISDCLNHDAIAVHHYSGIIINFIKSLSSDVCKIFFFSDGAPQQYKNFKHFVNLTHYKEDFGITVEWNFFATAHGKGPCDGIGGTLKQMAARASLQLPPHLQILTPTQFFEWCLANLPNIKIQFSKIEEYNSMKKQLEERFKSAKPIPATQKIHQITPLLNFLVEVKSFSSSQKSTQHCVIKKPRKQ